MQEYSFFCLRNDHWQLECMDTGYNDHNLKLVPDDITHLEQPEADWHQEQMLAAGARNIILMSHHQLFSSFATIGPGGTSFQNPYLTKNLARLASGRGLEAGGVALGARALARGLCRDGERWDGSADSGAMCGQRSVSGVQQSGDYTKNPMSPIALQAAPGFPSGYVQTGDDGLVYASGYAMLTLGEANGKAEYYQVTFGGDISKATSQLLWTDAFLGGD